MNNNGIERQPIVYVYNGRALLTNNAKIDNFISDYYNATTNIIKDAMDTLKKET